MSNTTGGSVWRNLAIALGDGLAFGVGVKLSQAGGGQPDTAPSEIAPLVDRIGELERRLNDLSLIPAGPAISPPATSGFDRRVLESLAASVVNAVNTRLQAQADMVHQRLAAFQARLDQRDANAVDVAAVQAVIAAFHTRLDQQDASAVDAAAVQARIAELTEAVDQHLAAVHTRTDRQDASAVDVAAIQARVAELAEAVDQRLAAVHTRLDRQDASAVDAAGVQASIAEMAEGVDQHLAAVRTKLDEQDASAAGVTAIQARITELTDAVGEHLAAVGTRLDQQDASSAELASQLARRLEEERQAYERQLIAVRDELYQTISRAVDLAAERQVEKQNQEMAELRAHLARSDSRAVDLIEGIGQAVKAATRSVSTPAPPEVASEPAETATSAAGPAVASDQESTPPFTQANQPPQVWRAHLFSSLIAAGGALALWRNL